MAEDPPLALGESELAKRLLPNETDKLRRGKRMQEALRTAIDQLAPIGTRSDSERWAYLIYIGEYEERTPRAEVQARLAISRSTYTRAKLLGLERIVALLPYLMAGKDAMDGAAYTAFLDMLTPRERFLVQSMMARMNYILNSDRVGIDADIDAENERIGDIERHERRTDERLSAIEAEHEMER